MSELFTYLPRNAIEMDTDDLLRCFPEGTDDTYLMRSIIMSEKQYPTVNYERSLRSLWYSVVKPTLDKLGKLTSEDQTEEGLTKWDAKLSKMVADLLRRGYLTYSDLNIKDNSRRRANPREVYYTTNTRIYGYKGSVAPYSNIIVATEKDTVYDEIKNLAGLFGCSCISCKGQNSLGAMEDLVRGILPALSRSKDPEDVETLPLSWEYIDWENYVEENGHLLDEDPDDLDDVDRGVLDLVKKYKDNMANFERLHEIFTVGLDRYYREKDPTKKADSIIILTMTDYDPAGYYIADALATQVADILTALDYDHIRVKIERIGIMPNQLSTEMVRANMYSPKPANLEKWYEKTGGIDGEPKGLELDALKRDQRLKIFTTAVTKYVNPAIYTYFVREAYIRKKCLEAISPNLDRIIKKLVCEYEEQLEVPNFNIGKLALQGYSAIPVEELCSEALDNDIAKAVVSYFDLQKLNEI